MAHKTTMRTLSNLASISNKDPLPLPGEHGKFRAETDSMGSIDVPADCWYGAQTARSVMNFKIGVHRMRVELILALVTVKRAAAVVNKDLEDLPADKSEAICAAADAVLDGRISMRENFPLVVFQTGSGTQTNMNVNEVLSNMAIAHMGGTLGSKKPVHPNDDVNKGQSSNDSFPTAMHVASVLMIESELLPPLRAMESALKVLAEKFKSIVKVGRTHLMDATPVMLGQEFGGYAAQVNDAIGAIEETLPRLKRIPQGGSAVGTGLNTKPGFDVKMAAEISKLTGHEFVTAPNKFAYMAAHDAFVATHGALKMAAVALNKIATDVKWLASGPRCGLGELQLPSNEPGSSIMPGKVNPTQCEAMGMVAAQVMGNDVTVGIAGSSGNFELNVFKPVIVNCVIDSIQLLHTAVSSFTDNCLVGIEPVQEKITFYNERNLMVATALNKSIGYDNAAKLVKRAHLEGKTLRDVAMEEGIVKSDAEYDAMLDPASMAEPK